MIKMITIIMHGNKFLTSVFGLAISLRYILQ